MAAASALLRARAFSFELLTPIDLGVHGVAGVGRVWQPGEVSDTWHTSNGYGIWLHLPSIGRTLSVTTARGNKERVYLDFGFIF